MLDRAKRASHIDPPASFYAIMRRARPYRGENPVPGKDVRGELDPTPGIRERPRPTSDISPVEIPHCNGLLPGPTTMAVMRCMAGSGSRKAWNASRDGPRSRSHQKEKAAGPEEPPPGSEVWGVPS